MRALITSEQIIGSPNTLRLRELQRGAHMNQLIAALGEATNANTTQIDTSPKPLLLKMSPDLSWPQLDTIINTALRFNISGLIATNTTSRRGNLKSVINGEIGGLSG